MRLLFDKIYHKYYIKDDVYKLYEIFNDSQYWTRTKLLDYQMVLFNKLWKYCITNVRYYNNLIDNNKLLPNSICSLSDLYSIPILTKDIVRNNFDDLTSASIASERFVINSTSGSTGSNFHFYSDTNQYIISQALDMRRYDWMDVNYFDREITIWGTSWSKNKHRKLAGLKNWIRNKKLISGYRLSDNDINNIYNLFKSYNPNIIKSYPSILTTITEYMLKNDLRYKPDAIHIGGEKLYKYQKEIIGECFSCPVFDFYGSRDVGDIAQNCNKFDGLHVFMENVIVEVVDDNGILIDDGEGDLIITNLHNYTMPLIRYKIGDRARISKDKVCSCGRNLLLIDEIVGRSFDIIQFPNGNRVGGTFWTLCMRSVPGIKNFQVIQEAQDKIAIYYVPDHESIVNIERIKQNIFHYSGYNVTLDFKRVDDIPLTKAGKMQFVISKIK
jgi:phenylacetate-CoA ligase